MASLCEPVCRFSPLKSFFIFLKLSPTGTGVFSHSGSLVICFFLPSGPTITVLSSKASPGVNGFSLPTTKSPNDGPVFNLSWNVVVARWGFAVALVEDGSMVVAKVREICEEMAGRVREESESREEAWSLRLWHIEVDIVGARAVERRC